MAILGPILGPVMEPTLSRVPLSWPGLSSFSATKSAIQVGAADINILVIGDSTGNETTEWVYLFGQWLVTEYQTHSVSYRLWDDGGGVYAAPVTLGTGSGPRTIHIWNASVAGAASFYFTGSKQAAAVDAVPADLIVFNMGKNNVVGTQSIMERGEFLQGIEAARLSKPSAAVATFLQSPNRDDNEMASGVAEMAAAANLYGDVRVLDAYSKFIALNKDPSLYTDNIHPSASGTQLWLETIQSAWRVSSISTGLDPVGALLAESGTNLLAHAKFADAADYIGGTPTGWVALVGGTGAVETTIKDTGAAQSMKVTGTTAQAGFRYTLDASGLAAVKAGNATFAVRGHVPLGSAASVGRVDVRYVDGGTTVVTSRATTASQGAFRWLIIPGLSVPASATSFSVNIYCDTAANASSAAYYDRAVLVAGNIPRNMG